jgi:pimeloyl-ACP methyl ester carboxylesterase
MSAIREHRIELNGVGTRALELDGEGPPLVLLHGYSDSADTWRRLLARLAPRGRRAVALDMPGFGLAARLRREEDVLPQLDRFVGAAVEAEAERAGEPVVVVGNSLGGCAAIRAAERDTRGIAGIVPIAPAGLEMARWIAIVESERLLRGILASPVPVPEVVVREVVGRTYRTLAFARPRDVDGAVVASFTRHIRSRRDLARFLAIARKLRGELRDPFRLQLIGCPVLLVWGDRDLLVFPNGADRVLREVPASRLEIIERCGHCPQIEAPDRLAKLLDDFPGGPARMG